MEAPKKKPRIVLLNAPRHFIGSRYGMGYQLPLGLVCLGGPLVDGGFSVKLIDADAADLNVPQIVAAINDYEADILMVGHTGSTAAYPVVADVCRRLKLALPHLFIVYGGVFPTFAYRAVMEQAPWIDAIVRGEGEETAVALARALAAGTGSADVEGLVWRRGGDIAANAPRPPIDCLDDYRFGWELVDWKLYHLFGRAAAAIQFSRGCIYKCSYCGQWSFWRRYRHRSPRNFVDQLQLLKEVYGVKAVFPADEHFAAERDTTERLLAELIDRKLDVPLYINTTVKDVLRDHDILPLYRRAGIVFAALGVESDSPSVQKNINKHNAFEESCRAVRLLRKHDMIALIQMIYGLEDEDFRTVGRKFRSIVKMDPDFANLEYITPHFWTPLGRRVEPEDIIQLDQRKWGYRNQVVKVGSMSETAFFWLVKLTELFVHLRPKVLWRAVFRPRPYLQSFRIKGLWHAFRVWFMEIREFYADTSFVRAGQAVFDQAFMARVLNRRAAASPLPVEEKERAGCRCPRTGWAVEVLRRVRPPARVGLCKIGKG